MFFHHIGALDYRRAPLYRGLTLRSRLLLIGFILVLLGLFHAPAPSLAQEARPGVALELDRLTYAPGDLPKLTVTWQPPAGDAKVVVRVYREGLPLSKENVLYETVVVGEGDTRRLRKASLSLPLRPNGIGEGGYPVEALLVSGRQEIARAPKGLAVVAPKAHPPLELALVIGAGAGLSQLPGGSFTSLSASESCSFGTAALAFGLSSAVPFSFAPEPLWAEQLAVKKEGFTLLRDGRNESFSSGSPQALAAGECLEQLGRAMVAPQVEVLVAPYASPTLPLLALGGKEGVSQYVWGKERLGSLAPMPGDPPGAFTPGLELDARSLHSLSDSGAEYTVVNAGLAKSLQGYASQPQPVRVRDPQGDRLTLFFAHEEASAALFGEAADATLFMAALARHYKNETLPRLVVAAGGQSERALEAAQVETLVSALSGAAWIEPLALKEALRRHPPATEPLYLPPPSSEPPGYLRTRTGERLVSASKLFEAYRLAAGESSAGLNDIWRELLRGGAGRQAVGGASVGQLNLSLAYLEGVENKIKEAFNRVSVTRSSGLWRGVREGEVRLTVYNGNDYPLTVSLALEGRNVVWNSTDQMQLVLNPGDNILALPTHLRGSTGELKVALSSGEIELAKESVRLFHLPSLGLWALAGLAVAGVAGGFAARRLGLGRSSRRRRASCDPAPLFYTRYPR